VVSPGVRGAPYSSHLGGESRVSRWDTERRQAPISAEPRGLYRKDYEDIGRIWKERQERRDTSSHGWYGEYRPQDNHAQIKVVYRFPGTYRYYCYDYRPGFAHPSIYCYYSGLFPPYIQACRTISITPRRHVFHLYVDLPLVIIEPGYWDGKCGYYSYYPCDSQYRSLSTALRDIQRAWELGDVNLLMRHVRRESTIDVFLRGEYAYSVDWPDYRDMTLDAMSAIRTTSFTYYRIRRPSDCEAVAYGKHVYFDDRDSRLGGYPYFGSGAMKTVYVDYTLQRYGSDWFITEVGVSP